MSFKEKFPEGLQFSFLIEKAAATEEGSEQTVEVKDKDGIVIKSETLPSVMRIEGIASTVNVDLADERMSPEALQKMADEINKNGVPLRSEHRKDWDAVLGTVDKAWLDQRNQLHISAKLDSDRSTAVDLYKAVKFKGVQLGLSVAGLVKDAAMEFSSSVGKSVKTFKDIILKEVSVTQRPCNFDTWLVAKNVAVEPNTDLREKHFDQFGGEFLKHYPKLDYVYSISKSVPDEFWDAESKNMEEVKKSIEELANTVKTLSESTAKSISDISAKVEELAKAKVPPADSSTTETATEEETEDETTEETTVEKKPEAKKAKPVKKEKETETETTEETTKSIDANEFAEAIAKSLEKRGMRLVGLKGEEVQKFFTRKGIASSKAYAHKKEGESEETIEKSVSDKDVSFRSMYKKHFSSEK